MKLPDHPGVLFAKAYRTEPESFWLHMTVHNIELLIDWAPALRWESVSGWGVEGWDPGLWPFAVIHHRDIDEGSELVECDVLAGTLASYCYPTREIRDAATDELAFLRWKRTGKPWVRGISAVGDLPARLRGPFSWERVVQSRGHPLFQG